MDGRSAAHAIASWTMLAVVIVTLTWAPAGAPSVHGAGDEPSRWVTTYRGDAARTGVMLGPAPLGEPMIDWTYQATAGLQSAPLAVEGTVFQASRDGVVHAISQADGSPRWATDLGAPVTATPLIIDGTLIVGDELSTLHAVATTDGRPRWRATLDGATSGAAAWDGDALLIATRAGSAHRIDPRDGAVVWRTAVGGPVERSVTIADGVAFLGVTPATVVAIAVDDGRELWRRTIGEAGLVYTPTLSEGRVFAALGWEMGGSLTALDAATGQPLWTYAAPPEVRAHGPAVAGGKAIVVRTDGVVEALDAATGAVAWSTPFAPPVYTQPAVVGDQILIASAAGSVHSLEADTGNLRWSLDIRGAMSSLVVADGQVLVPTDLGILYAIGGSVRS